MSSTTTTASAGWRVLFIANLVRSRDTDCLRRLGAECTRESANGLVSHAADGRLHAPSFRAGKPKLPHRMMADGIMQALQSFGINHKFPLPADGHPIPTHGHLPHTPPHTPSQRYDASQSSMVMPPQGQDKSAPPVATDTTTRSEVVDVANEKSSSSYDAGSRSTRKSSPKVVGQKFEDGVLKIIYDPDDLRRYRLENGLKESDSLADSNITLSLLPLASGGHDHSHSSHESSPPAVPSQSERPTSLTRHNAGTRRYSDRGRHSSSERHLVPVPVPFSPPRLARSPQYPDPASEFNPATRPSPTDILPLPTRATGSSTSAKVHRAIKRIHGPRTCPTGNYCQAVGREAALLCVSSGDAGRKGSR